MSDQLAAQTPPERSMGILLVGEHHRDMPMYKIAEIELDQIEKAARYNNRESTEHSSRTQKFYVSIGVLFTALTSLVTARPVNDVACAFMLFVVAGAVYQVLVNIPKKQTPVTDIEEIVEKIKSTSPKVGPDI